MKFLRNSNSWILFANEAADVRNELPAGNYTIRYNEMSGQFFLEDSEPFQIPLKIYGKTNHYCDRIISAFHSRKGSSQVGTLLEGTKGSGKTLLAKLISNRSGLPTIIVNTPFTGEKFMRSLQEISQPAVIIFDEFEKLYDHEKQEQVLTMFDGVYSLQNKIIIVTSNDRFAIREFFHNRPSRLRYSIHYSGLDSDFIEEYCDDNLEDTSYRENIITFSKSCLDFNFDMLQILVDELNLVGGNFDDVIEILNVKPVTYGRNEWEVSLKLPPELEGKVELETDMISINPIEHIAKYGLSFDYSVKNDNDEDGIDYSSFSAGISNISKIDQVKGLLVLKVKIEDVDATCVLRKKMDIRFDV